MKDSHSHNQSFRMAELVLRHLRNQTNQQEEEELERWLNESEKNRAFLKSLDQESAHAKDLEFFSSLNTQAAWEKVARQTVQPPRNRFSLLDSPVWRYAAMLLVLLGLALLPYRLYKSSEAPAMAQLGNPEKDTKEITPGGDRARLELADGTVIILDQTQDGQLKSGDGAVISKNKGVVVYTAQQIGAATGNAFNTITTPKGGQFQIVLADGTKVWLNAASSLRFPTAFTGAERSIEMTGEAYFEVAKDKTKPFRVTARGVEVKVLGTHFNVMAYENEQAIKTTLVEGAVQVSNGRQTKLMQPHQQASVSDQGFQLVPVDPEEYVAWKNGYFHFQHTSLQNVMRQLERWYDIELANEKALDMHFTGVISRTTDIDKLLHMLESTGGIHFARNGKKVTASKVAE